MCIKKFSLLFLLLFFISPLSWAHPGGTDADGGHSDYSNVSGLGQYHYHHGYPAHLHKNGDCPYDFDDKTGQFNGGTSATAPNETSPNLNEQPSDDVKKEKESHPWDVFFDNFLVILLSAFLGYILYIFLKMLLVSLAQRLFLDSFVYTKLETFSGRFLGIPILLCYLSYPFSRALGYHIHWYGYLLYFLGVFLVYLLLGYIHSPFRRRGQPQMPSAEMEFQRNRRIRIANTLIVSCTICLALGAFGSYLYMNERLKEKDSAINTMEEYIYWFEYISPKTKDYYFDTHVAFILRNSPTYHSYDCPAIKGRTDCVIRSVQEAEFEGYTPCPSCHIVDK